VGNVFPFDVNAVESAIAHLESICRANNDPIAYIHLGVWYRIRYSCHNSIADLWRAAELHHFALQDLDKGKDLLGKAICFSNLSSILLTLFDCIKEPMKFSLVAVYSSAAFDIANTGTLTDMDARDLKVNHAYHILFELSKIDHQPSAAQLKSLDKAIAFMKDIALEAELGDNAPLVYFTLSALLQCRYLRKPPENIVLGSSKLHNSATVDVLKTMDLDDAIEYIKKILILPNIDRADKARYHTSVGALIRERRRITNSMDITESLEQHEMALEMFSSGVDHSAWHELQYSLSLIYSAFVNGKEQLNQAIDMLRGISRGRNAQYGSLTIRDVLIFALYARDDMEPQPNDILAAIALQKRYGDIDFNTLLLKGIEQLINDI
jgi:hypothetical protein